MQLEGMDDSPAVRRVDAPGIDAWFAALAGVGAFWLVQGVLVGVAVLLVSIGVFHHESGPLRFEPTLLPAALAGAFAAWRLGGWRGLFGVVAFASVPFLRFLSYPLGAAIDCSHGATDACRAATDLDFVLPQAWLLPGLAIGVATAALTRARVPLRDEFAAAAPIALVHWVGYVLPMMLSDPAPSALDVITIVIGPLAGAYLLARRASHPMRSALFVAGVLLLVVVPWIVFTLRFNTQDARQWLSLAGPVVLVIATFVLSMTMSGRPRNPLAWPTPRLGR
jgi:hypothetical protein